jgi:cob(I)alamin adenosyltransferase
MTENELAWENVMVLEVCQAFLGLVTDNVKAIAIAADRDLVVLHVLLAGDESEHDRECIEDAADELDVLLDGHTPIETVVVSGGDRQTWAGHSMRVVFLRADRRVGATTAPVETGATARCHRTDREAMVAPRSA